MNNTKIKVDVFRHVESELYAYPYRKREVERIRLEIMHPFDEQPEDTPIVKGKNSARMPGDPTGRVAITLAASARLMHLERVTDAIDEVYERLTPQQQQFVKLKYWTKPQKLTTAGICAELDISDRTFSRWRSKFIGQIAENLGWK